jgi:hypothetical protein
MFIEKGGLNEKDFCHGGTDIGFCNGWLCGEEGGKTGRAGNGSAATIVDCA